MVSRGGGNSWGQVDAQELAGRVGDRLVEVEHPLVACRTDRSGTECAERLEDLHNPFFVDDHPGAFHTTGWLGAFDSVPSRYALAAESATDLVGAVELATERGLPLVVKGTGHDYLGRSSAAGSLSVWTRPMRKVAVHERFVPAGAQGTGVPAVTVEAGTRWIEVYHALALHGRYVVGGGCNSVGAAGGFTQGGGFGSFSKRYGTAACNVLQMEVVTADGGVLTTNDASHPDLFWALRGGGGGTFGIVSKVTFATFAMPKTMGGLFGSVTANNDTDFELLVRRLVDFLPHLEEEHFGEQVRLHPDRRVEFLVCILDMDKEEAREACAPWTDWVGARSDLFSSDLGVGVGSFAGYWDPEKWEGQLPGFITRDGRPGSSGDLFWWSSDQGEVSRYIETYKSQWLPAELAADAPDRLTTAFVAASKHWPFSLHLNKGLSGAPPDTRRRAERTSVNPVALDATALIIMSSTQQYAYPSVAGFEPEMPGAGERVGKVAASMESIRAVTGNAGSYVNETDYFQPQWQRAHWGANYERLVEVKLRYDPSNLFRVHHGVGSEP